VTTELHLTIRSDTAAEAILELATLGARAAEVLGVAAPPANSEPTPALTSAPAATPTTGNGADTPTPKTRGKKAAEPEKAKLDRAAIIDGLTKIYSQGDPDKRQAITKFRDGQGADRLRDLKDDALPAAAELLIELKSLEAADAP
jgi:hypothetical protein